MSPARPILLLALLWLPCAAAGQTSDPPFVEVDFARAAPTPAAPAPRSAESIRAEAAQAEAVMAATLEQTRARLDAAREARDIVQVNCVTARLATIKGLLGVVQAARESLDEAAARSDRTLVEHEGRKISIARARAEAFRVQVEGCVGEISQYTGDTRVELQVDPALRTDDPSKAESRPVFLPVSLARPPALSGSQ